MEVSQLLKRHPTLLACERSLLGRRLRFVIVVSVAAPLEPQPEEGFLPDLDPLLEVSDPLLSRKLVLHKVGLDIRCRVGDLVPLEVGHGSHWL